MRLAMQAIRWLLVWVGGPLLGLLLGSGPTWAQGKKALVIGNAGYQVGALSNPANDARLVAGLLRDLGYQVTVQTDLSRKGMREALHTFGGSLSGNDEVFVYYAGHGFEINGKNYLMGVDYNPKNQIDAEEDALRMDVVLSHVEKARVKVVILDACRNDPFSRQWRSIESRGFAAVSSIPSGTFLAYSTAAGHVAEDRDESTSGNGPYALALKAGLRSPGSVFDVFTKVSGEVRRRTGNRQVPWLSGNLDAVYYLSGPAAAPTPPRPDPSPAPVVEAGPSPGPAGIEFVRIEGGSFQMGSSNGDDDERPIRRVTVPSFELAKTEVTVGQYRACVDRGPCNAPNSDGACNWGKSGREDHPINCVDWDQAATFARWANARLPSEAEWEYAARSRGRDQTYPWGDAEASCSTAVMKGNGNHGCGQDRTWPVCSKSGGNSAQGVCDLAGNVWEWVEDWYGPYGEAPSDGSARSRAAEFRVVRGGGWNVTAVVLRAARRYWLQPGLRRDYLGFRIAR